MPMTLFLFLIKETPRVTQLVPEPVSKKRGLLAPVRLLIPKGSFLSPALPALHTGWGAPWSLICPETSGRTGRWNRYPVREHLWGTVSYPQVCEHPSSPFSPVRGLSSPRTLGFLVPEAGVNALPPVQPVLSSIL